MIKHPISYFFFGAGIVGLLFALCRTYYLVWKLRAKGDAKVPGSQER
jgi:hypothetical protein